MWPLSCAGTSTTARQGSAHISHRWVTWCCRNSPISRYAAPSNCSPCSSGVTQPRTSRFWSSDTSSRSYVARPQDPSWSPPTAPCSPPSAASWPGPAGPASPSTVCGQAGAPAERTTRELRHAKAKRAPRERASDVAPAIAAHARACRPQSQSAPGGQAGCRSGSNSSTSPTAVCDGRLTPV
jgi:hypothetical protein